MFLKTKSFALLSVSSPFPFSSSASPIAIVVDVAVLFARLSLLVPAEGLVSVVVSLSVALPKPTLSMRVLVLLYSKIVLLSVIEFSLEAYV